MNKSEIKRSVTKSILRLVLLFIYIMAIRVMGIKTLSMQLKENHSLLNAGEWVEIITYYTVGAGLVLVLVYQLLDVILFHRKKRTADIFIDLAIASNSILYITISTFVFIFLYSTASKHFRIFIFIILFVLPFGLEIFNIFTNMRIVRKLDSEKKIFERK